MKDELYFCKKCGRIIETEEGDICDCCGASLYEVPEEYTENFRWRDGDGEQALMEELIKTSPEFDPDLSRRREEIIAKRHEEFNSGSGIDWNKVESAGKNGVTCSYCGSANVSKIGFFSRLGSAELWGLGSDKIGKQFHCNNCGANF